MPIAGFQTTAPEGAISITNNRLYIGNSGGDNDDTTGTLSANYVVTGSGLNAYIRVITGSVNAQMAIYEDTGTLSNDVLVSGSSVVAITNTTLQTINFPIGEVLLESGKSYKCGLIANDTSIYIRFGEDYVPGATNDFDYIDPGSFSLPSDLTGATSPGGSNRWAMWFEYQEASTSITHFTDVYVSGPVRKTHTTDIKLYTVGAFSYPLSVDIDNRWIYDANNNRVFFKGESAWSILPRLTIDDMDIYIQDRKAKGFNSAMISLIVHSGYGTGDIVDVNGNPPFNDVDDWSTLNSGYWNHIDSGIQKFTDEGFQLLLWPAYLGYQGGDQGWTVHIQQQTVAQMRTYGEWIGTRYQDFENIIWSQGGDTAAVDYGIADEVNAIASGIKSKNSNWLHTAHNERSQSALDDYNETWLSLNSTYTTNQNVANRIKIDWDRTDSVSTGSNMPTFYIEGWYEYRTGVTEVQLRAQAYLALLGGTNGHFYGCEGNPVWTENQLWDFADPSWSGLLDAPVAQDLAHYHDLVRNDLVPDWDEVYLTSGRGSLTDGSYAMAAVDSTNEFLMAYTPSQKALGINMSGLNTGDYIMNWIDPKDASETFIGLMPYSSGLISLTPPSAGDWVLTAALSGVAEAGTTQSVKIILDILSAGWTFIPTGPGSGVLGGDTPNDSTYMFNVV